MHRYCLIVPFLLTISTWAAEPVYVETVTVPPETSAEKIVEMAAHVVPHPRQMIWHRDEFISFIHFGVNTFTGAEWGSGNEDPNIFNPEELDTDQWCEVMKEAGITRVILTVKHHDGFCLWQTRYVKHAVTASTKWRNGKGDVLRDLAESCEKYGLRLGVYLSPADRYMKNTKLYGNGSSIRKENVPSWVAGRPFADTRSFTYELDDYNLYFMNQMFELLTEYGHIYEVWFDGAAASGNTQKYNRTAWFDLIRRLAPDAMIAVKGPDTRWCGNEAGGTRESEFNVAGLRMDHIDHEEWNDNQYAGQSRSKLKEAKALHYYPAETNTSIRHGWFYRDDEHQEVRTADDVFDIYERAVGGNSVFLLNIPPNTKGTFSDRDVETLLETGKRIRAVYGHSVSEKAVAPANVLDGDDTTYWQADGQAGELVVRFPTPRDPESTCPPGSAFRMRPTRGEACTRCVAEGRVGRNFRARGDRL
jgi:alpha-L-fucosidase